MHRRGFASLALASLVGPLVSRRALAQIPPPARLTPSDIAAKVDAAYASVQTYRARFSQRSNGWLAASRGTVVFETPDKMRWSYDNGNQVVSEGYEVRVYEADNHQLYVMPSARTHYPVALSFLTGQGGLAQSFALSLVPAAQSPYKKGHVLRGVPLTSAAAFQQVLWYVEARTFRVRRVEIKDAQGNRNRCDFERPLHNRPLGLGAFELRSPPGTRIITP